MKLTISELTVFPLCFSKRLTQCTAVGLTIVLGVLCGSHNSIWAAEEEPVRQGLPGRRISGASRSPGSTCAQNSKPLVAIVPETNLGTTAAAEPTLWLSLPKVTTARQLEFYLFNAHDEIIYQTDFNIKPTANLVGLDLSQMSNAPKLEINQRYRWAASIICNPDNPSENISVEGWVDRVDVSSTLDTNRLWYDHLGILVEQIQHHPQNQDALSQWQTLMASARLEQIVPFFSNAGSVEITVPTTLDSTN